MEKKSLVKLIFNNKNNNNFIYELENKKKISYRQLKNNAEKIASSNLIKSNMVVTVILENSIDFIEIYMASLLKGWIINPLPYFLNINELKKILSYINPKIIITDKTDIINKFKKKYKVLSKNQISNGTHISENNLKNNNLCSVIYYSSGTTGSPKGIMYSQNNLLCATLSVIEDFKFNESDNQLAILPFGHTASFAYNVMPSLVLGNNLYISKGFSYIRGNFFKILDKYKITYTQIVPSIVILLNKMNIKTKKNNYIKFIGCGSSILPLEAQKEFIKKYKIKIGNMYGLSEVGPAFIDDPRNKNWTPGSIGRPISSIKYKISKDNEILFKTKSLFIGYYKNMKLYKKSFKNSWFMSGDLIYNKKKKIFYKDRKKDLIIKGGINIVPQEIEEIVYKCKDVQECVVVGKYDEILGEDVILIVKKKNNTSEKIVKTKIYSLIKNYISTFKMPKEIIFYDYIPKTISGKILRKQVREEVNKDII